MGLIDKIRRTVGGYDDEYDEELEGGAEEYEEETEDYGDRFSSFSTSAPSSAMPRNGRVVSIQTSAQLQVMLAKPERFEEVKDIAEQLNKKVTVVLNLEICPPDIARRILDFLSGAAFANNGTVKPVANKTFLLTPSNVDLMGDLLNDLESSGFSIER